MAATSSIIIEVQSDAAVAKLQQLNAQMEKTGATLQPVQRISEQTFNNIEGGALKARESAALLGEEFGVKVPRALRGVIAESSLLGPAFTAAFSGLAVLGFIEIVKQAVEQLTGFGEALKEVEKQNAAVLTSVGAANKILMGPQNLEQITTRLRAAQGAVQSLNEQLGLTGDLFGDSLRMGLAKKFSVAGGILVEQLGEAKKAVDDLYVDQAKLRYEETHTEAIEILKLKNAARLEGLQGIARINEAERGETQVVREEMEKSITHIAVGQAEITAIHARAVAQRTNLDRDVTIQETRAYLQAKINAVSTYDAKFELAKGEEKIYQELNLKLFEIEQEELQKGIKLDGLRVAAKMDAATQIEELEHRHAVKLRLMEDETLNIEKAAAVAMAPPWERANKQIVASYEERIAKIKLELDAGRIDSEHAARQSAAAWQEAFAQMRDKLANDLETLFDNVTSGNIGKWFLQQFKHMVFQMVATWILGMQQMRSASQQQMGSGGGILGAIFGGLGGIFGGGGGGGSQGGISNLPGVITNFGGGNGDFGGETSGGGLGTLAGSIGLSGGGGDFGGELPSGAARGSVGAISGPLGNLLGKIFSHGAGPISGTGLAALGAGLLASNFMGGGILHGLGGAAGGALLGFSIGGPIGALIGGIAGFLSGVFQHSTKNARLAIEADIKSKAKTIEDSYNLFQSDWTSSRDALEQLRQAGVDALKQAGVKDIDRSRVGHVDQWINKAENEIDATQAERNRRAALTFGPAQFRTGGFVGAAAGGAIPSWFEGTAMHFAMGGAVPALLHEGEYVFRPEAVSRIGRRNLDQMNSGSGGGTGGDIHIHINAIDAKSFEGFLASGGDAKIARAIRRGNLEGRW